MTGQGWPVDLVAPPPYNSEALLGLPELQDLHGQRLLLLRGEGGRRHLAETLRSRGAQLDEVACYRRLPGDARTLQPLLQPLPHMAMATSGEALLSLQDALGSRRSGMVLVAGGERVAGSASGWQQVVVAPDPGDEAMTGAVLQSQQSMGKPSA
ncbi:MAG: uroporphyrinogen-III synthase [Gammaproteobacteria bacterium]|nr:MAG: uroporphyrinogen-III synthase [Gammaproteobacteria bacterium]